MQFTTSYHHIIACFLKPRSVEYTPSLFATDLTNFDCYDQFVQQVSNIVKEDGLNVLFNNAGVAPKSTRISFVKTDQLLDTFTTNTVAPIMLTKALLPLLKKAAKKNADKSPGISKAAVINMSSFLGSIDLNTDGGLYPYRCSKVRLLLIVLFFLCERSKYYFVIKAFIYNKYNIPTLHSVLY